jgi:catechol 2,3-dioxygenase-like lactoylglutathione lyase family enzyme
MTKRIHAVDHVALTVPDLEQATAFFQKAFDGKIVVEGLKLNQAPWEGQYAEIGFGMPRGGKILARRVINIGGQTNIELFVFDGMKQRGAAHTYDYGLQHFAVYVDDLSETAKNILDAGGKLYAEEDVIQAIKRGYGPHSGWMYCETPWGSVIEVVTFQEGK